ncbi:MAG: hypothetical protein WDZ74_00430 [Candidatus Paceibacterota bacterium]
MTREEIQAEIKFHQTKVEWFQKELRSIKLTFQSQKSLSRYQVDELRKKRRTLGILQDRHQEKIRALKQRAVSHKT